MLLILNALIPTPSYTNNKNCNGVARTLKKLRTSKEDYWIKQ